MESLDKKCDLDIEFFEQDEVHRANRHTYVGNHIWTIDNFINREQCNAIIKACNKKGFSHLNYRNSERILFYNDQLKELIEERLTMDYFLERLNLDQVLPYGFNQGIEWDKNTNKINPCFRCNKYNKGQGFKVHRDAQYTSHETEKSNYTLLIYLNDNDGNTVFHFPLKAYPNNGYTIDEEIPLNTMSIPIIPKMGTAVIFDQRLLHEGLKTSMTKYVLRTDMICTGKRVEKSNNSKVYNLCKSLFRQAQYQELLESRNISHNGYNTTKLYEICIGLRQTPYCIDYPKHLEKYLIDMEIKRDITSSLHLISRNGLEYKYRFNGDNIDKIIKMAFTYAVLSSTSLLSSGKYKTSKRINRWPDSEEDSVLEEESSSEEEEENMIYRLKKIYDVNFTSDIEFKPQYKSHVITNPKYDGFEKSCYNRREQPKSSVFKPVKNLTFLNRCRDTILTNLKSDNDSWDFAEYYMHLANNFNYEYKNHEFDAYANLTNFDDYYDAGGEYDDYLYIINNNLKVFIDESVPDIYKLNNTSKCPMTIRINAEKIITSHEFRCSFNCPEHTKSYPGYYYENAYITFDKNLKTNINIASKTPNSGIVEFDVGVETFNHASCEIEDYIDKITNINITTQIRLNGEYKINNDKLTITLVPRIVM